MIWFLFGSVYSLIEHRRDHFFFSRGMTEIQAANTKLAEMKKMNLFNEKWAKHYIARGQALVENDKPSRREKGNRVRFEKLIRKYRNER